MADKEKSFDDPSIRSIPPPSLLLVKTEEPEEHEERIDPDRYWAAERRAEQAELTASEWMVKFEDAELLRIAAEEQLQKEKEESARAAESQKAETEKILMEMKEKYESAPASSVETAKLVESVKIEKRKVEEELEKIKVDFEAERKEWNERIESSENIRSNLMKSLNEEWAERERERGRFDEIREMKKRMLKLMRNKEELDDRVKKLTEQVESLELSLTEAKWKAEEAEKRAAQSEKDLIEQKEESDEEVSRLKAVNDYAEKELENTRAEIADAEVEHAKMKKDLENMKKNHELATTKQDKVTGAGAKQSKLQKDLDEMRKINELLATTEAGKIYDELTKARKRIEELEKNVEPVTKASENAQVKKSKRRLEEARMDDMTDEPSNITGTSESLETEKRRRSSRVVSKLDKKTEPMKDSDGNKEPPVKKSRSEIVKTSLDNRRSNETSKEHQVLSKNRYSDIECPECKVRSNGVDAWTRHLREKHSTTSVQAGLALLCGCGHLSHSSYHTRTCKNSEVTVIREKKTPQCVLCEVHPKTPCGYVQHLRRNHKSSLEENGIYLICSCNYEVRAESNHNMHGKTCDGTHFTLHKLDEK